MDRLPPSIQGAAVLHVDPLGGLAITIGLCARSVKRNGHRVSVRVGGGGGRRCGPLNGG